MTDHDAHTSAPINPVLAHRWSPRSFDESVTLTAADLTPAFEAARWAPSANNLQPWRFIVGFRGDETFNKIAAHLTGSNLEWAPKASALVAAIAQVEGADGTPQRYAAYDLGQAVAHLSMQAYSDGLSVHQMGGIDRAALEQEFNLPAGFNVYLAIAVGKSAAPEALPEALAAREKAPRVRHELTEIVRYDAFEN